MYNGVKNMEAQAVPTKFTKKDIQLLDHFIEEGYFSTRSDLIRTSVRHYLHELTLMEIQGRVRSKKKKRKWTKKDIKKELKEIRGLRRQRWKDRNG
jgi:metal-responsive CopG/Arc/MetJ family transcriptional regulator